MNEEDGDGRRAIRNDERVNENKEGDREERGGTMRNRKWRKQSNTYGDEAPIGREQRVNLKRQRTTRQMRADARDRNAYRPRLQSTSVICKA